MARLKRDDPALAAQVVNGEVSAYAAARSKGWKVLDELRSQGVIR